MRVAPIGIVLCNALIAVGFTFASGVERPASTPPVWAYGTDPAAAEKPSESGKKPEVDKSLKHLPDTDLEFTMAQIQDHYGPADWYPNDHKVMPEVVAHGRKPAIWACALCHFPNGKGKPENASVVGYPASYFVEQMHEFRSGQRKSADSRKTNTALMSSIAKAMTDEEIEQAATYFSGMQWTPWIKVVETQTVPKTHTSVGMYMPIPNGGTEPIGRRIIEVPGNPEETEALRNPRSGFIAYAPIGSIHRGEKLVTQGMGKTNPCGVCHGADLKGLGPIPGIAGRSPSYLVRQLYDMQQGTRNGSWTELMKPVVEKLSEDDMVNIAAYTASLKP